MKLKPKLNIPRLRVAHICTILGLIVCIRPRKVRLSFLCNIRTKTFPVCPNTIVLISTF